MGVNDIIKEASQATVMRKPLVPKSMNEFNGGALGHVKIGNSVPMLKGGSHKLQAGSK